MPFINKVGDINRNNKPHSHLSQCLHLGSFSHNTTRLAPSHHDISNLCADDYRRTACTSLLKYIVEKDQDVQGERISHTIQAVKGTTFSHISVYYSVQRKKERERSVFFLLFFR